MGAIVQEDVNNGPPSLSRRVTHLRLISHAAKTVGRWNVGLDTEAEELLYER